MKNFVAYFLSLLLPIASKGHCILSEIEFICENTDYKDFLRTFYSESCRETNISPDFSITIRNSRFEHVDCIPNLFTTKRNWITNLTLANSSVQYMSNDAFSELIHLKYLDLSWNKLRKIQFVVNLPKNIKELHLNNNNITYLDDVFSNLRNLLYLDLSFNAITIVDFGNVFWMQHLNFSHNKINTLIPSIRYLEVTTLDLSYNNLETFNENLLRHSFHYLNLDNNKLTSVELQNGERKILGLSGNQMKTVITDSLVKVDVVDLSFTNLSFNFNDSLVIIKKNLILKNNNITILNCARLNVFCTHKIDQIWMFRPQVDLSNSSITDISPLYFSEFKTVLLNLSNNNIHLLRDKVFFDSAIETLDLSNCGIEVVQKYAFKNLTANSILLDHNQLEIISNVFNEVEVIRLDISFNKLKTITNRSFINCRGLFYLDLGNCFIEKIEPEAFLGLEQLQELILSYNKLFILEPNSFNNLPVRELQLEGNKIYTIRNRAFNGLHNLKKLNLTRVRLANLEPYAFNNLSQVEVVDLSFNNITMIPHYLFIDMTELRVIFLHGNNITTLNPLPKSLKIQSLTLSFKGMFKPNKIRNLNIEHLHIVDSKIDILKNNSFVGLYNLKELYFNKSYVYVETGALNNLFNLRFLDSRVLFKHVKVIERDSFKDLKCLQSLDLSNLTLQSIEPKAFIGMDSLEKLSLNMNNLVELKNDTFYGLNFLKMLNLSNCNIKLCEEQSFNSLESLEFLHLEYNNLMSIDTEYLFGGLNNLLELHLEHNNISSLHIKSFIGLPNLLFLNLHNNNLVEFPIGVFQYLPKLKVLDLSNNMIQLLKTGALSNLQSLEVLNLSDNLLVNLEYVDIFFSLKQLQIVLFDGNYLKQFDFKRFLINLRKISYVGISNNKWKCDTLSYIIESFNNRSVDYRPKKLIFDDDNIEGIGCVDMCKFLYCSHENVEQTLRNNY